MPPRDDTSGIEDMVRSFYVELTLPRAFAIGALADEGDEDWTDSDLGEVIQEGLGTRIDRQIGQKGTDDNRASVGIELTDAPADTSPTWTAEYNGSGAQLDAADRAAVEYAFNDLVATYRGREGEAGVR